jgi:hypothetical protein
MLTYIYRQVYPSTFFIVPVVLFTLLYNVPKFFELVVREEDVNECPYNISTVTSFPESPALNVTSRYNQYDFSEKKPDEIKSEFLTFTLFGKKTECGRE